MANAIGNFFPVLPLYIAEDVSPTAVTVGNESGGQSVTQSTVASPSEQTLRRSVLLTEKSITDPTAFKDVLPTTPFMLAIMVTRQWVDTHSETLQAFADSVSKSIGDALLWIATVDRDQFNQQYGRCQGLFNITNATERVKASFRPVVYPAISSYRNL